MTAGDLVLNFVVFQVGWLVAVAGAGLGYPLAGVAYALMWLALHHWQMRGGRMQELTLVLASAGFGFLVDSMLVLSGIIAFPAYARVGYPSTLWMVSLWVMFAMTLRHSLGWLRNKYLAAAALGAVFGPLAYWAGSRLGAIYLCDKGVSMVVIAAAWTGSMIGLLRLEVLTRGPRRWPA